MRNTDEISCKQLKSDIKWCEKKILELEEEDLDIEYMERKIDEARKEVVNNNEVAKSLFVEYKFKCLNKREKEDEEDKRRRQVKLAENEARRKAKQMYMEHIRDKDQQMEYAIVVGEYSCYNTSIFQGKVRRKMAESTVRDL